MHRWNKAQDYTSSVIIKKTLNLIPYGYEIERNRSILPINTGNGYGEHSVFFKMSKE